MAQNSPKEECICRSRCREDWVESGGMGKVPNRKLLGSKQVGEKVAERENSPINEAR